MGGSQPTEDEIRAAILNLALARAPKTFCPSEVARGLVEDWRPLMPMVRAVAADLAAANHLSVTQKGEAVDALVARGPIRLSLRGSSAR